MASTSLCLVAIARWARSNEALGLSEASIIATSDSAHWSMAASTWSRAIKLQAVFIASSLGILPIKGKGGKAVPGFGWLDCRWILVTPFDGGIVTMIHTHV